MYVCACVCVCLRVCVCVCVCVCACVCVCCGVRVRDAYWCGRKELCSSSYLLFSDHNMNHQVYYIVTAGICVARKKEKQKHTNKKQQLVLFSWPFDTKVSTVLAVVATGSSSLWGGE